MGLGQALLDPGLVLQKPTHAPVRIVFADLLQPQFLAQSRGGGLAVEVSGKSKFGARIKKTSEDKSAGRIAFFAGLALKQRCHSQASEHAQRHGDVSVRERPFDIELLFEGKLAGMRPLKQRLEPGDNLGIPMGEIGQGALFYLAVFVPIGLAQEDSRRRAAIGNGLDVHGFIKEPFISL